MTLIEPKYALISDGLSGLIMNHMKLESILNLMILNPSIPVFEWQQA